MLSSTRSLAKGSTSITVPSRRDRLGRVRRRGDRIAHVVQAVEEADQVVARAGIVVRPRRREGRAVGDARLGGDLLRLGHRFADACRSRGTARPGRPRAISIVECPWPQPTSATTAPAFELLDDAVEGRQPFGDEAAAIGVAVEGRDAAIEPPVMVAPGDALAGAEGLHRLVLVEPHRGRNVPGIRDEDRAVLVGEDEGLLRRQLVGVADAW